MNFDFSSGRITLVLASVDMRAGYSRLALMAAALFNINVDEGKDFVVFVSRRRNLVKMIWSDPRGHSVLTRRLHKGRFEKFLQRIDAADAAREFTPEDLMSFLDGRRIYVESARYA